MKLLWTLLIGMLACLAADEPGFVSIFNGKDLSGWTIRGQYGPGYIVEDEKIVCPSDGGGNLFTVKEYSNFILRFEFRLEEGSNNGIGIRAPYEGDAAYKGMEIQILDHDAPVYRGKLRPAQYHGSIYDVVPAKTGYLKEHGRVEPGRDCRGRPAHPGDAEWHRNRGCKPGRCPGSGSIAEASRTGENQRPHRTARAPLQGRVQEHEGAVTCALDKHGPIPTPAVKSLRCWRSLEAVSRRHGLSSYHRTCQPPSRPRPWR